MTYFLKMLFIQTKEEEEKEEGEGEEDVMLSLHLSCL